MNRNSYWFPAKKYGWGWGPPTRWQGWVVLLLWAGALAAGLYLLRQYQLAARLGFVLVMGLVLMLLCYWKGEPPAWRSGGGTAGGAE